MQTERVITVEYLEPSMSKELLRKFPDDSAFGFDYQQSGIWSPLVPRVRTAAVSVHCPFMGTRGKRLPDGYEKVSHEKLSKVKGKIAKKKKKKKKTATVTVTVAKKKTLVLTKKSGLGSTPDASATKQGWGNMLRAATKHFKKQKRSPMLKRTLPNM